MKKYISFFLVLSTLLSTWFFSSCANLGANDYTQTLETGDILDVEIPKVIEFAKAWRYTTYGDYFFFLDLGELKYQMLNDPQKEAIPVYADPLSEHIDSPFASLGAISFVAVDTVASAKNGGIPILIVGGDYFESIETSSGRREVFETRIGFYNMATGEFKLLKTGIQGTLMSLSLYKDRIFFCIANDENGWNLYSVCSSDGKDEKMMPNPDKDFYRLFYVAEDRIYYWKEDQGILTSCDLNFKNIQTLFPIELVPEMFIFDEKIYYATNRKNNKGNQSFSFDICYRSISDISKEETLLTNITIGMNWENYFYYYSAENIFTFENNTDTLGGKILYCVDVTTGKIKTIYDKKESVFSNCYIALGENYVVYQTFDLNAGKATTSCIHLTTGEEVPLLGNI